jgi:hypothetical protein
MANEVIDLFDDAPVGALPKRKAMLALVGDDSSEEDTLCRRKAKIPKPAPPPQRGPREEEEEAGTPGRGSPGRAASSRNARGNRKIVVLDDDPVELTTDEQHDPEYLKRQLELARLQTLLHASAAAVEEEEPEPEVEEVPLSEPPRSIWDEEPPRIPTPQARRKIRLNVRTASQHVPTTINLYADASFEKLIAKLAEKLGGDPRRARLTFDGDVIQPKQTPASLDMEDEDLLDFALQ